MRKKFLKYTIFSLMALMLIIGVMNKGEGQDPKPMGTNIKIISTQNL